jgi:hypothetical protein
MANASLKPTPSSAPTKRRLASDLLSDDFDTENMDPAVHDAPSKRAKGPEGTPTKISKFTLITTPKTDPTSFKFTSSLSLSIPPTTTTPISHSRGSPKNRRIAQLTSKRRSSTPIRRFDPPHSKSAASLPFSIDAALQGTISNYTPSSLSTSTTLPANNTISSTFSPILSPSKPASKKPQPSSWFFAIHEDSEEQESTNLLLHNASVLDISSDDDAVSARAKDALERGKENVPPPEYVSTRSARAAARAAAAAVEKDVSAMEEDRKALREMDARDFWVDGKEEVVVVVDETEQETEEKVVPAPEVPKAEPAEVRICEDANEVAVAT